MNKVNYAEIRDLMKPGDVLAFGGRGFFSWLIKLCTRGPVSHVGIVMETHPEPSGKRVNLIESTSLDGHVGVCISRFSDRLHDYDGLVWWLPLSQNRRRWFEWTLFYSYLLAQNGKPYDYLQGILSPLTWLPMPESFHRLYCSELVTGALEQGGVIRRMNASKVTPMGLCKMAIFHGDFQLKGKQTDIPKFNTEEV